MSYVSTSQVQGALNVSGRFNFHGNITPTALLNFIVQTYFFVNIFISSSARLCKASHYYALNVIHLFLIKLFNFYIMC